MNQTAHKRSSALPILHGPQPRRSPGARCCAAFASPRRSRRGLDRARRHRATGRLLESADRGLGLSAAAMPFEEAHRLRQPVAHHHGIAGRDETDRQGPAPAIWAAGHHEVADQRGQNPADRPERLQRHDQAPPDRPRRILTDQRRGDRQLGTKAKPHDESQRQQRGNPASQRRRSGRQPVHEQRQREHLASPDAVRQQATDRGSQRHPDKPDRGDPGQSCGRQLPLFGQGDHDERDEPDIHCVQGPTHPGADEQSQVGPGERKRIEALGAGGGNRARWSLTHDCSALVWLELVLGGQRCPAEHISRLVRLTQPAPNRGRSLAKKARTPSLNPSLA